MARAVPGGYKQQPYNGIGLTVLRIRWQVVLPGTGRIIVTFNRPVSTTQNRPIVWYLKDVRSDLVQGSTKFGIPLTHLTWKGQKNGFNALTTVAGTSDARSGILVRASVIANGPFVVTCRLPPALPDVVVSPIMPGVPGI